MPLTSRNRRPVAIDLFAGAGGLSLGFEGAGFDVVAAVEYDPVHAATHLYNFPESDVLVRDISTVSGADLLAAAGRGWARHYPDGGDWDGVVDSIIGGPSCQGFSSMGRQDSGDERNQLVLEFVRLVEEVRPRTFCMENVPGLLQPQFAPLLATALRRLRAAGYSISGSDVVLRAEDFGVPQKRRRVLIMGTLTADAPDTPVGDRASAPFSVADAFRGLPSPTATLIDGDAAVLSEDQIAGMEAVPGSYLDFGGLRTDSSGPSGRRRLVNAGVLSGYRLTTHRSDISARFLAAQQGMKEPISRFYKLSSDLPALTLRAGTGRERGSFSAARPIHPLEPRVITVREAARLHSFPDWFRFHTTNWHGHRQIGNAVPPLLARAAAKSILKVLGIDAVPAGSPVTAIPDAALLALSPTSAANQLGALLAQVPQDRRGLSGEALTESVPAPRIGIGELSG